MDLQKAKILLEKINALHKSMSMDVDNIAEIEKDLMLNYMQQLYECYLSEGKSAKAKPEKRYVRSTPNPTPQPKPTPQPVVKAPPPPPPPAPKPVVKPAPVELKAAAPPPPPVQAAPAPVNKAPAVKKAPASVAVNGEVDGLFEHIAAKELSEKLSAMPIKDLNKAMGLNEKLLTINQLFKWRRNGI